MSVLISVFTFLPVALFFVSMCILLGCLQNKLNPLAYTMFSGGFVMSFLAGVFSALWRLLYSTGVCDFQSLKVSFLPMQSCGFLLMGLALGLMLLGKGRHPIKVFSVAAVPAVLSGRWIFTVVLGLGALAMNGCLFTLAKKLKRSRAGIFFIAAGVGLVLTGYMCSRDFDRTVFYWIAEIISLISQLALFLGVLQLKDGGLKNLSLGPRAPEPPMPYASPVPEGPMYDAPVMKDRRPAPPAFGGQNPPPFDRPEPETHPENNTPTDK